MFIYWYRDQNPSYGRVFPYKEDLGVKGSMILWLFFPYKEDMNVSLGLECKLFPYRDS